MKKAWYHILYLLIIVFFLVLAQIKAADAQKNKEMAEAEAEKFLRLSDEVLKCAAEAVKAQDEAEKAMLMANEANRLLKECEGK